MDKELQLDEEESASSQQTNTDNDEVLGSQSQMIIAAKYLHIKFLNTVVQVNKILQTCDDVLFHKAYSELYAYASGSNVELLFTSDHISKHDTIEEILKKFSFLWSWHNFSVLRTLLKSCNCQDGLTLLDDFESQIDESQPVECSPYHAYHQRWLHYHLVLILYCQSEVNVTKINKFHFSIPGK